MLSASPELWFVLDSGRGDSAFNMALDEALLECAPGTNRPVLRFYGWTQPTASFGYFQKIADIERTTSLRPLVRRPTGGGLVPHDADWTYSVVVPPNHQWYALRARESYERMHRWIQSAFILLQVRAELASCCRKEISGQCFAGHEELDVLVSGKKVAGAAQRRKNTGLLIQGSIQPPPAGTPRTRWQEAMCASAEAKWGAQFEPFVSHPAFLQSVEQLATDKFASETHNRRR